jgi:YegS/Rv2252/BmrU family lipid kinase
MQKKIQDRNLLVVINPKSSNLSLDKLWQNIEMVYKDDDISYDAILPEHKKDIEDVIRSNLDNKKYDTIVVVGGDGTVSAAARAIVNKDIDLSIVPTGTANVIARELNIPSKAIEALSLIKSKKAKVQSLNAINVNKKNYFLRVSVGLTSIAVKNTDKAAKSKFGRLAYLVKGIKDYFKYYDSHFKINIDGDDTNLKASDIIVTNFQSTFFPLLKLSDEIKPQNNKLDVLIFKSLRVNKLIKYVIKSFLSKSMSWKESDIKHIAHAKELFIDTKKKIPVQGDGDFIGYTPIKIKVIPEAVKVITPK